MSTTITPPAGTEKPFDAGQFIKDRNEREHQQRETKPPAETKTETKPPTAAAPPAGAEPAEGRLPRSARRELNHLREEVGRLTGQIDMLRQLGIIKADGSAAAAPAKPEEKPAADPEPQRKDFADDKQYERAMGRWEARQEANKVLSKRDEQDAGEERLQQFRTQVQAMQTKATEDIALFQDWEDVKKAAVEADDAVEFEPDKHPQLMALLALSDVQAGLYYHFAKHPKELEQLLSLTAKPEEQIKSFHRLEGRIDRLYYTDERKSAAAAQADQGAKPGDGKASPGKDRTKPEKGTQARAAELPAPTESAAASGGSTPASDVKPILENGKINPAWKAQRNEREGLRR